MEDRPTDDTTTTPTPSPDAGRVALAEIVAGLDGVTPGPWTIREYIGALEGFWVEAPSHVGVFWDIDREADALHATRLTPETIRSIAAHVSALEARALAAKGREAVLREALETCAMVLPGPSDDYEGCQEALDAARAALTPPTEGETP